MPLEETVPIQFLTELQPLVVVVVETTVVAPALPAEVVAAVVADPDIMQVVVVAEPAQQEEMQQCHQALAVNTVMALLDKVILAVEAVDTFTLPVKAAAG
jgi:hypothetical protein